MYTAICIPSYRPDDLGFRSLCSFVQLCTPRGVNVSLDTVHSADIAKSRSVLLAGVLRKKPDRILWIDADMDLSEEAYEAMLNQTEDYVSACYVNESGVLMAGLHEGASPIRLPTSGHETIEFSGFGCVSMSRELAEDVSAECIQVRGLTTNNMMVPATFLPVIQGHDWWGEDRSFCLRARNRGYELLLDCSVRVGHRKSGKILSVPDDIQLSHII